MHEAMDLIYPIVEVIAGFRFITWLWLSAQEAIWTMEGTWNVDKVKMEHKDREDPAIYAGRGHDVWIC
jgi:hypothetical protein